MLKETTEERWLLGVGVGCVVVGYTQTNLIQDQREAGCISGIILIALRSAHWKTTFVLSASSAVSIPRREKVPLCEPKS